MFTSIVYLQFVDDQSNQYSWQACADVYCRVRCLQAMALGNHPRLRASLILTFQLVLCFRY